MCVCLIIIVSVVTVPYNNSDNHMIYQIVLESYDIFNVFPNVFISDEYLYNMFCVFLYLCTSFNTRRAYYE